jgi:Predicted membrane protein
MNGPGTSAGLGLLSAATWGGSDFVGGLGARRAPAMLVVASGHFVSFVLLVGVCLAMHLPLPANRILIIAVIAGFEGALALAIFYRALAMGAMGLTAALTGVLTALVPVVFSMLSDGIPAPTTAAGLLAGLVAIWLITHTPGGEGPRTPRTALMLGALSGLGFGLQLVLFKLATNGGLMWTLTSARAAGSLAMLFVIVARPGKRQWTGFWRLGVLAGVLDTIGNMFYLRATQIGRLDVAAVICSLYPAGTILLAAIVLRELPSKRQLAGMAVALGAVMLLSA